MNIYIYSYKSNLYKLNSTRCSASKSKGIANNHEKLKRVAYIGSECNDGIVWDTQSDCWERVHEDKRVLSRLQKKIHSRLIIYL